MAVLSADAERVNAGHGPDRRPEGKIERQESQPIYFPDGAARQVVIEDGIGLMPKAPEPKIHDEESEIVEHIDGGETVVELQRVEEAGFALPKHDVLEVQIAVAVADEALSLTLPD